MPAPVLRAIAICLALTATAAFAEPQTLRNGDDLFLSGLSTTETLAAPRDVLAAGATVSLRGTVAADTHATGFDVEIEAATGGSVYAAGATVTQRGTVGQDLNATGFTVRTTRRWGDSAASASSTKPTGRPEKLTSRWRALQYASRLIG